VDHRRPSSFAPAPTESLLALRPVVAWRVGLDAAVRKGRDIVVTNIVCFKMALSDTFVGKKLRTQSNGRWEESMGGRLFPLIFENVKEDDRKRRLVGVVGLDESSRSVEDWGEVGRLSEGVKRNTLGGDNEPGPTAPSSSASDNSSMPSPPDLRQTRATRSAHSSTLTKRTAPASSIARGLDKRKMRTAGNVLAGKISGGW
jgi:hypothetical protein